MNGPSGCGKSSRALAVLQLRRPASGRVRFEGRGVDRPSGTGAPPRVQPVFQDPYGSLSPRHRIRDAVAEQGRWDRVTGQARSPNSSTGSAWPPPSATASGALALPVCHDPAVVRHFADRVVEMRDGRISPSRPLRRSGAGPR
ncbi:ATP-binding cassette domain-containing protein [Streptomyces diastatochromogenes]|nr:ATP-binding cassette domain-containing protein [Streptomyces diastatochromogenes]